MSRQELMVTTRLPRVLFREIKQQAKAMDMNLYEVFRQALAEWLFRQKEKRNAA